MKRVNFIWKFFLICFLLLSCSSTIKESSSHWEIIKTNGLKTKYHDLTKLIFVDEKNGFIIGSESNDDTKNQRNKSAVNAIISKTTNGGLNWKTDVFGKGVFFHFQKINPTILLAIKKVYSGLGRGTLEYIEGFDSKDSGMNWNSSFKTKIDFKSMIFLDSLNGIGISRIEGLINNKVYATKDGGENWNELNDASGYYFNNSIEIQNSKIYLLGSNKNESNEYNLLFEIDLSNGKIKIEEIKVGMGSVDHIYIDANDKFWLIKDGNKKVEIFLKNKNDFELFKKIESTNQIFLDQIYSHNNVVNLILSETLSNENLYSFARTEDMGESWTNEEMPLNLIEPSTFYGDNYVWIYSGGDRLQVRK